MSSEHQLKMQMCEPLIRPSVARINSDESCRHLKKSDILKIRKQTNSTISRKVSNYKYNPFPRHLKWEIIQNFKKCPGANPTTSSYNARVVKI
jgi:hypothetical protein